VDIRRAADNCRAVSALAKASSVPNDGDRLPFSILESVPAEIPAAAPSSATVKSIDLRSRRTSSPMLASSGRTESSLGAVEPVRRLVSNSVAPAGGTILAAKP
jgi:hypothetical protein